VSFSFSVPTAACERAYGQVADPVSALAQVPKLSGLLHDGRELNRFPFFFPSPLARRGRADGLLHGV